MVAIDGPAGAGKSTLARGLARALGVPYVNTGVMYRAVAAAALEHGVRPDDGPALAAVAKGIRFELGTGDPPELTVDGAPSTVVLVGAGVEAVVSQVSAHAEVRAVLRAAQRALGAGGAVLEGRDIATVVFPDADAALFVTAAAEVRALRRARERGGDVAAGADLARRDGRDARTSPLEPAPGAVVLDTSNLGIEGALERGLAIVRGRLAADEATGSAR